MLTDDLYQLLETRSGDDITHAMIQGAWSLAEHLHTYDGSLWYQGQHVAPVEG